jgi:hypothetical protein
LPTFCGYTVDVRLKEFRRIPLDEPHEFMPFKSEDGDFLAVELLKLAEAVARAVV